MTSLIAGIVLWALVHLVPSLAPAIKQGWLKRLGEGGYKGTFSLLLLAALALIVFGWRSSVPEFVYLPAAELRPLGLALLVVAVILFVISNLPSRIKRWIRHPQMSAVILWGVAHLMLNGDSRSLVLFAGMTSWAVVEIIAINRRDGVWIKSPAPGLGQEMLSLLVALAAVVVFILLHPYIAGVAVFPG